MTCYKPGERSRLIYAIREYWGRKDEPKGFGWKDYRDLVIRARNRLSGPIVLVWDNLRMHLVASLREFFEANAAWITVFQPQTLRSGPQSAVGHLVPGQTRHRQPCRRRPGPGHPRGEAQAQDASVPACGHRRLPGGHWPGT
ncbi:MULTISPECIES: hypothetical protein [unclassified Streptomyces]|uniref:hypothetical protein n=1 Tax=unclassified Streptomyces TaxID=2593676 RepID=UPI0033954C46